MPNKLAAFCMDSWFEMYHINNNNCFSGGNCSLPLTLLEVKRNVDLSIILLNCIQKRHVPCATNLAETIVPEFSLGHCLNFHCYQSIYQPLLHMVFTSRNWFAMQEPVAIILISWNVIFIWETGYCTRAIKRFAFLKQYHIRWRKCQKYFYVTHW
jgi:hypothetical protein